MGFRVWMPSLLKHCIDFIPSDGRAGPVKQMIVWAVVIYYYFRFQGLVKDQGPHPGPRRPCRRQNLDHTGSLAHYLTEDSALHREHQVKQCPAKEVLQMRLTLRCQRIWKCDLGLGLGLSGREVQVEREAMCNIGLEECTSDSLLPFPRP